MIDRQTLDQLVALPHRQYVGLVSRVRFMIIKQREGRQPPADVPALELTLYRLGAEGFTALRRELAPLRRAYVKETKAAKQLAFLARRAAYMKKYRRRQKAGGKARITE